MNIGNGEKESDPKKKYVFFSDPNVIVRRAETTAISHAQQQLLQLQQQEQSRNAKVENPRNLQTLENLLENNPVPPHPFTFITAVKRKLALGGYPASKKAYDPDRDVKETTRNNRQKQNSKMNYIKPLKVPDLKISPKTLDYSSRDSPSAQEDMSRKDSSSKNSDRVHRKLEFSHSGASSILNSENIEPLKTPDFSISSSLNKKKDHSRDHSKEKENRLFDIIDKLI